MVDLKIGSKSLNLIKVLASCISSIDLKIEPVLLDIDVTNQCSLKCLMCPNRKMSREKGIMGLSLFKEIVQETSANAREYSLGIYGEPTAHPDLIEMIGFIKDRGRKVTLNTNLNYRNDELNESFVRKKVDRVIVTMCGIDKTTYEAISLNGDYDLLIRNLAKIKEIKRKLKSNKPVLVANFSEMKLNSSQAKAAKKRLKKHFDYCNVHRMHDWAGDNEIRALRIQGNAGTNKGKCSLLWTTASILHDGRVAACCQDYDGKMIFGDAKSMKISKIWNDAAIRRFRKEYLKSELCKNCMHYNRFQFSAKNIYFSLMTTI